MTPDPFLPSAHLLSNSSDFDRSKRILNIACGTGRHAIELAQRGYRVAGFDLSESQLRRAREKATAAGVAIEFQRRDATQPHYGAEYEAALMLCEGAFPWMETDENNHAILRHAAAASGTTTGELTFDLMTFRERAAVTFTDDAGQSVTIETNERYHAPPRRCAGCSRRPGSLRSTSTGAISANPDATGRSLRTIFEMLVVARRR